MNTILRRFVLNHFADILHCGYKVIVEIEKHAFRPNKFQKEEVQQVSPCKPFAIWHFLTEFINVLNSV